MLLIVCIVATLFLGIAGIGWFAISQLHQASLMLVRDTLPGLIDAGSAAELNHESRHLMRQMLEPANATNRATLIQTVRDKSTDDLWNQYGRSIFTEEDSQNFQTLLADRKEYLDLCAAYFDLITQGKIEDATALYNGRLATLFYRYNQDVKTVFDFNVRQGVMRGQIISKTARFAPLAIALLSVLLFVFGLAIGMRFALSGSVKKTR